MEELHLLVWLSPRWRAPSSLTECDGCKMVMRARSLPARLVSADGSNAVPSPSRVRVPLVKAVDRASIIRLKRGTARELKDSSFVQADLAFEQRLWNEMNSDDLTLSEDWRNRRGRELEREAQLKAVEAEEEKARLKAGGKRKRKLALDRPADPRQPRCRH